MTEPVILDLVHAVVAVLVTDMDATILCSLDAATGLGGATVTTTDMDIGTDTVTGPVMTTDLAKLLAMEQADMRNRLNDGNGDHLSSTRGANCSNYSRGLGFGGGTRSGNCWHYGDGAGYEVDNGEGEGYGDDDGEEGENGRDGGGYSDGDGHGDGEGDGRGNEHGEGEG